MTRVKGDDGFPRTDGGGFHYDLFSFIVKINMRNATLNHRSHGDAAYLNIIASANNLFLRRSGVM